VSCTYIIICGLISFSQLMDNDSLCLILNFFFQFCIINKWYWIDLTIFCWRLTCYSCSSSLHIPYFFSFTILFQLAWIELVDVRKEHFYSPKCFHLSLRRKRYVLKEMRNRNSFVVFFIKIIKYFVLYESDGFTCSRSNYIVPFLTFFLDKSGHQELYH